MIKIISTQFSSIWLMDRTLSIASTPGLSGPGSNCSKGVLHIPENPSISGASPSDCFVSYPSHTLGNTYPSAERHSVYSAAPATRASYIFDFRNYIKDSNIDNSHKTFAQK